MHADEEEIDEQFLKLHNELFEGYDCNYCGNCCKKYPYTNQPERLWSLYSVLEAVEEIKYKGQWVKNKWNGIVYSDNIF